MDLDNWCAYSSLNHKKAHIQTRRAARAGHAGGGNVNININTFEDYLINKNLKKKTIEDYLYYFTRFAVNKKFNQQTVSKFLSEKTQRNPTARSLIKNLQKFLIMNYKELNLTTEERLEISEVEVPILTGRKSVKLVTPLTEDQIWEIENVLDDEIDKLRLLMSFYGGLRIGELLKIQIISFNWQEWKKDPSQYCECKVLGKGDKEGIAFFPPWLIKRVAAYIRSKRFPSLSSYIFLNNTTDLSKVNFRGRKGQWQKKLREAGIKAGLTKLDDENKVIYDTRVHPHRIRHSYGFHLKSVKGFDIRDIQVLLRHSDISSTQRYVHVDKGYLKKILQKKFKKEE